MNSARAGASLLNIFVPLFMAVVAACWFLVATGRVSPTDPRLLAGVGVTLAAGAAVFLYAASKARRGRADEVRRLAVSRGWAFAESVPCETLPGFDRFEIFTGELLRGDGGAPPAAGWKTRRAAENVLRGAGPSGGVEFWAFDLTTESVERPVGAAGRGSYAETVVCVRAPRLRLPRFAASPRGVWPGLAAAAGVAEVALDPQTHPARRYSLRGTEASALRRLFETPALGDLFASGDGLCAEGEGDRLVFYRHGALLPPDQLDAFIRESLAAADLFQAAAGRQ